VCVFLVLLFFFISGKVAIKHQNIGREKNGGESVTEHTKQKGASGFLINMFASFKSGNYHLQDHYRAKRAPTA
jgi:hypothetical protein